MYFYMKEIMKIIKEKQTVKSNKVAKLILAFIIFFLISFFTNNTFAENEDLKIYSDACILLENKTGKILYEKNANQKMYPASTTKILTAILTL